MLGAAIYDKVIKFYFSHNHKIGKWDKYHIRKNTTYHNKIKWNENFPKSIKLDFIILYKDID